MSILLQFLPSVPASSLNLSKRISSVALFIFISSAIAASSYAEDYFVAPAGNNNNSGAIGNPFKTIQHGLDVADQPGDRIYLRTGTYHEKVAFPHSGTAAGYITLRPYRNEAVKIDGTGVAGENMILLEDVSYIRIMNLEIVNNRGVTDGSGIRLLGTCRFVAIVNNEIHEMRGENAMGITVYGTKAVSCQRLYISGNHVHDCSPAPSEAIVVNGNVEKFTIQKNLVHDVNNIGIDVIGGELDINSDPTKVARFGSVRFNTVFNARSSYGGGYAAGIYVDGGRNIVVDSNDVSRCDLGIEIGAENPGTVTTRVIVRNNIVHKNDKVGIVFGGYDETRGRVQYCRFVNNTVYGNDTLNESFGQLWISFATNNVVANNIFYAGANRVLMYVEEGGSTNTLNFNLWYADAPADEIEISWSDDFYGSLEDFRAGTGRGNNSLFADPQFINAGANFHLSENSPAIDSGNLRIGWYGKLDFDGTERPKISTIDMGAFESLGD